MARLGELCAAARQGASADDLGEAVSRALAPVVAHDALSLVGSNPGAGFGPASFSFRHRYDPALGLALLRAAYAGEDPCTPRELVQRPVPAGVTGADGGGHRDLLARRLLASHGVGSELRLLLRDARGVWGCLVLLRAQGGRPFEDEEVSRAAHLAPTLIAALRAYVTAGPLVPADPAPPTGVIIVGPDHEPRAVTPPAHGWRQQLRGRPLDWTTEPYMFALSMQARKHAQDARFPPPLIVGPAASHGRWLACDAQPLGDGCTGDVAVIIQAATAEQLFPAFCDWYGITARERQVIVHLREGMAPKQIARRLDLSLYTVNDHLRAIFRKTGARGRDELITAITT
ncbi:helix-turn-helix transcriptional regulator [Actinomadura rubrisoli]|uniref:Helix-turn-helix transcriptional regulator n=1 Tax=Actinomadura rubrisoli TaxID=2530368 RepID=A0A4R5B8S2_9ACTN|nr:helix-turn-helix transcriptional regulator [Actinomadura rubrisoli]TDD81513.1 helix-turn-helix transcriptional regulator [Actinomadura rubrisoli]